MICGHLKSVEIKEAIALVMCQCQLLFGIMIGQGRILGRRGGERGGKRFQPRLVVYWSASNKSRTLNSFEHASRAFQNNGTNNALTSRRDLMTYVDKDKMT